MAHVQAQRHVHEDEGGAIQSLGALFPGLVCTTRGHDCLFLVSLLKLASVFVTHRKEADVLETALEQEHIESEEYLESGCLRGGWGGDLQRKKQEVKARNVREALREK